MRLTARTTVSFQIQDACQNVKQIMQYANEQIWDLSCQMNGYKDGLWCKVATIRSQIYQFTLCISISFHICWIWINTHWRYAVINHMFCKLSCIGKSKSYTYLLFFHTSLMAFSFKGSLFNHDYRQFYLQKHIHIPRGVKKQSWQGEVW